MKNNLQDNRTIMDINELSEHLSISVSTLYKWVSMKQIPYAKVGRRVVFDQEDIKKWFNEHKVMEKASL